VIILIDIAAFDVIPKTVDSIEQMLQTSCCCYQKALALEPHDQQKNNLQRRLGNIHNELGVLYMNLAAGNIILTNIWRQNLFYILVEVLMSELMFSVVQWRTCFLNLGVPWFVGEFVI
jgi:hypothetical protein